ncbi:XRE family transcriptional regulator [Asticcacaulis solisilvae]|uniref:XRE family transcriptional regulator n=1 Tax=Asticcacaulis solisilvae TaxID=1217274 RepID=UPI003FD7B2A5
MIDGQRVAALRKKLNLSQDGLAELVGMSGAMIGKLERGEAANSAKIYDLARALGTSPAYLSNETDDDAVGALPKPTPELIAQQLDVVQIPVLDLRFGMGGGGFADSVTSVETMPVGREFIRMFSSAPVDQLVFAIGIGDSMYPTIHDRDGLLIDTSQRELRMVDQIWALYHYGMGMVKRVRPTAGGYIISSDNPHVADIKATDDEMSVVGRVVAAIRRF